MTQVARFASELPPQASARAEIPPVGRAWSRELERRAQAFSWFPTALAAPKAVPATAATAAAAAIAPSEPPAVSSAKARLHVGAPSPNLDPPLPAETQAWSGDWQRALGHDAQRGATPASSNCPEQNEGASSLAQPAVAVPRTTIGGPARQLTCAPVPRQPAPAAAAPEQPAVRLHVEHGPGGLQVWLGVDAHDRSAAACAATLIAGLLADGTFRAHRLAAVVCNGATVYASHAPAPSLRAASHPFQEQPWQSAQ